MLVLSRHLRACSIPLATGLHEALARHYRAYSFLGSHVGEVRIAIVHYSYVGAAVVYDATIVTRNTKGVTTTMHHV